MPRSVFARPSSHSWTAPLIAIALTFATAGGLSWAVYRTVLAQAEAGDRLVRLSLLSGEIRRLDEALTSSARLSAASGDLAWEARYNADVPRLDAALSEAMALTKSARAQAALARTAAYNQRLIALETAGFDAARAARFDRARALVLGKRYQTLKSQYSAGLDEALREARATADEHSNAAENRLQVGPLDLSTPRDLPTTLHLQARLPSQARQLAGSNASPPKLQIRVRETKGEGV